MLKRNSERRKFIRLPVHHLLRYKVVGKQGVGGVLSFARNISAGGLLFHAQENVPAEKGAQLEIEINFPSRETPLTVIANVLRVKPLKKMGGCDVALEFIGLDTATRNFINNKIITACKQPKRAENKTA